MFTGIEVEGRFKGIRTLFIPMTGEVPDPLKATSKARELNISHIYYGAGRHKVYRQCDINLISAYLSMDESPYNHFLWTIETHIETCRAFPHSMFNIHGVRFVFSTNAPCPKPGRSTIEVKLDGPSSALIFSNPQEIDTTYTLDKEL